MYFSACGHDCFMRKKTLVIGNEHGIHARVALRVVETGRSLGSRITLCKGCAKADGCSILEMLMLQAEKGSEVEVLINGGEEEKCLAALSELFSDGLGI